ncbi:MAG TPA: Pls/PosA family non-ribosomal peptide synthetase [Patescibacteria group bacterium]|nr:Pls/PosA family non-ribosomal peptide synthetase [Patescibacteria group bacterium]
MNASERLRLLQEFNGPPFQPDYCRDEFLHELFQESVTVQPEKIAVECGAERLSYRELDQRSTQMAHYLRRQGFCAGDYAILMLDKTEQLYIAMIAVMKAGGAYVPVDLSFPIERVDFIIRDSVARICITSQVVWEKAGCQLADTGVATFFVEQEKTLTAGESVQPLLPEQIGLDRHALFSPCYIIYTSGTTGRPKGCIIDHRNICNYVRGATVTYGIKPDDRILQCASIAFDASLEEIWMALANGGTLIPATKEIMQSGSRFGEMLTERNVTVLSCSPTLLSMAEGDMETVRVIILGGEACPHDLVKRWYRPGRTLYNSYGPTEATIVATVGVLHPEQPVTIGRALPNYQTYIVDEKLELVALGEEGELLIAGPGVSRGYLNMDDLDLRKFIVTNRISGEPLCLYRTGDLARFTATGDIEYLGRSDDQVKLRGFRVELSEIESVLMQDAAIQTAAVALHPDGQQLAAYVVVREGKSIDYKTLRETLKKRLPPYMIPAWMDEVSGLPTSVSGKVNRKQLPAAQHPFVDDQRQIVAPRSPVEEQVADIWKDVLKLSVVSVTDDFFYDLGGHSLLAAGVVSRLRKCKEFAGVAVGDLYKHPTIESLAGYLATLAPVDPLAARPAFRQAAGGAYWACAVAQGVSLIFFSALNFWQWLGSFVLFAYFIAADYDALPATLAALSLFTVTLPMLFVAAVLIKWLLLGRIQSGSYPLWGEYYFRYWFVRQMVRSLPIQFFVGSPLLNWFYRLMGADIGQGVYLGSADLIAFDLLTIGAGSTVGTGSSVNGAWVDRGMLHLAPIVIGEDCTVGNRSVLSGNNRLETGAALGDLSLLPEGVSIPANELWSGSPAKFQSVVHLTEKRPVRWSMSVVAVFLLGAFTLPVIVEGVYFPWLILVEGILELPGVFGGWFLLAPFLALAYILTLLIAGTVVKFLLCFDMREGRYPVNSVFYLRYWLFIQVFRHIESLLGGLFGTVYTRRWLMSLGLKLGPGTEASYVRDIVPGMLETGAGCFLADDASLSGATIDNGYLYLKKTRIGDYSFIGNSASVPAGSTVGSGCLVGVSGAVFPENPLPDGTAWLGSPPLFLPNRQKVEQFGEEQTFRPSAMLLCQRYIIDFVKILLPSTLFILLAVHIIDLLLMLMEKEWSLASLVLLFPGLYIGAGVLCILIFWILKNILVGRYQVGMHPLWSPFVWVSELLTGLYEDLVVQFFFNSLLGTPYAVWVWRLFGVQVGRRCYIDTSWITEFDLVEIGDDVALNEEAGLQTHLFEDRVMKLGRVRIGDRCTVGSAATILYDTELEDDVTVGDLTLIMKGEMLPAGSSWQGLPGQPLGDGKTGA